MSKKKPMTEAEADKLANATFDRVLADPDAGNARIIAARRSNAAPKFDLKDMKKRAKYAAEHVIRARKALKSLGRPSLERFK